MSDPGVQHRSVLSRYRRAALRLLPLALLAAGVIAFFAFDLGHFLSFEVLQAHRADLADFVSRERPLAAFLFLATYALVVAFSLPLATLLSVTAGLLFGVPLGTILVVAGATLGATAVFLVARSTFGAFLSARAGSAYQRIEAGFQENAFSYLLVLRLVPIFPFFVVNIVPGLLHMSVGPYVLATVIGIIPAAVVFVGVGAGAGSVLDTGSMPGLDAFLRLEILLPILGLMALALVPVAYKKLVRIRR